jgi:acetyltransferase-like isoleucine patch superfamily enzyme
MKILKPLGLWVEAFRGKLQFGTQTRFETPIVMRGTIRSGTNVEIGAFSAIYGGALHWCRIGRYCSFAAGTVIGPSEHAIDWLTTSLIAEDPRTHDWHAFVDPANAAQFQGQMPRFAGRGKGVSIGNDVWLGDGVFVRTGVSIGDGAVIGARSVVVSDIPPYAIAVGNPARVKRLRFPESIVERLLKLQWWRLSLYELLDVSFDRIEAAIDTIEDRIAEGTLTEYRPETYTALRLREVMEGKPHSAAA